jgi:hypothetical protein
MVAMSPYAVAEHPIYQAHAASRRNDPLIHGFLEATTDVWPDLRVTPQAAKEAARA